MVLVVRYRRKVVVYMVRSREIKDWVLVFELYVGLMGDNFRDVLLGYLFIFCNIKNKVINKEKFNLLLI